MVLPGAASRFPLPLLTMPTLLHLTFRNPQGHTEAASQAAWERADQIAAWPGLIWKTWIHQPEHQIFGGIYLFEDQASADAYLEGPIVASIQAIPEIADFTVVQYQVDEARSRVTRALP